MEPGGSRSTSEALAAWSQLQRLGIGERRLAELAPLIVQRLADIDDLWAVNVTDVEPALTFSQEGPSRDS